MTRTRPLLCFLLFSIGVPSAVARAEGVALVEFRTTDLPPALIEQVRKRMVEVMRAEGYKVVPEEVVAKKMREISVIPGCTVGPCLARLGRALHTERALLGGVASQGSNYDLTLTLLETGGGTVLAQVSNRCEVCNFKEVEDTVIRATVELHKQGLVYLANHAILAISSTPTGATVLLDNLPAGKTPLSLVLSPGPHLLEVSANGAMAFKQEVVLAAGKTRSLRLDLSKKWRPWAIRVPIVAPQASSLKPWWKWTALGVGLSAGVLGGGLWALDGRETSDERYVYDTKNAGLTMVSLGASAVVGAAILYFLERHPAPPRNKAALLP
jgi:hypothetical protein